jgi:cytochrome c oxidase subunit 3
MSIITILREKPWEVAHDPQYQHTDREYIQQAGLRVILVVISVLFFLFIVAFLMRSQYPDWQPLAEQTSQPLFDRDQLWLNTVYLLLASVGIQFAKLRTNVTNPISFKIALFLSGVFSSAFIGGQLTFWASLQAQGFMVNSNPALSFFYLFTGLHMAHVGVGVATWLMAVLFMAKKSSAHNQVKLQRYVALCATYWHYLLGLWAVLFLLLVSKPETYNAIVEFCGLGVQ